MVTYILVIFSFFIVALANPAIMHAQRQGTLEVNPAYQEVVLEKTNQETTISLIYTNHSPQQISLELYPIDFSQQGENGGISFLGRESGTYAYSLSSFLSFESNALQLGPGEKRTFTVVVRNREDISPGGHYAAIIAKQVQGTSETTVSPAISSLIFMRKTGGERFNVSIQKTDWPRFPIVFSIPKQVGISFQNAGNIHVIPYGRLEITDMFGRLLQKGTINSSSAIILPESRRLITAELHQLTYMLPLSLHTMAIKGSDSLQKVTYVHQESFLYINPWLLIILLLVSITIVYLRKRKKIKK
jgi:hypothetical protein